MPPDQSRTPKGARVRPLNVVAIRSTAESVRQIILEVDARVSRDGLRIDPGRLLEHVLPQFGITYLIEDNESLGDDLGLATPDDGVIRLRQNVYERMTQWDPMSLFTLIHELGHIVLHIGQEPTYARAGNYPTHRWCED